MKHGMQDWDCADSLDLEKLREVLLRVKEEAGEVPKDLVRQGNFEDGVHGVKGIHEASIEMIRDRVARWSEELKWRRKIVIVDGFLLFGRSVSSQIGSLFDRKILLRASYLEAKRRREARNGYVTLEGFWEDPPDYFDKIVWPNYIEEHGFLLTHGGDVEKEEKDFDETNGTRPSQEKVFVSPISPQGGLDGLLEWVVGILWEDLQRSEI